MTPTTFLFHTFTTGMWQFAPDTPDAAQPKLIGIGCLVLDDDDNEMDRLIDMVTLPPRHSVTRHATEYHGISDHDVREFGKPAEDVYPRIANMMTGCQFAASYGADVHMGVLRIGLARAGLRMPDVEPIDIMKKIVNICRIPDRSGRYKWPKMHEAYEFFRKVPMNIDYDLGALGVIGQGLDAALVCYEGMKSGSAEKRSSATAPNGERRISDKADRDLIP